MSAVAPDISAFGYEQELKRALSLRDLLVYGLVFIIPTAPIASFGIVFNASHGMVPLVYVVGLVAMLFTARSYVGRLLASGRLVKRACAGSFPQPFHIADGR